MADQWITIFLQPVRKMRVPSEVATRLELEPNQTITDPEEVKKINRAIVRYLARKISNEVRSQGRGR